MTKYDVQFELPCEDPVNKVRMERRRGVIHFFVPLNHPDAHNLGLSDLIEAVERAEKFALFTGLNNTVGVPPKETVVFRTYAETIEAAASKVATESLCDEGATERAETIASCGLAG